MMLRHLSLGHLLSHFPQVEEAVDRIEWLHGSGLDFAATERVEALAGQLRIVA